MRFKELMYLGHISNVINDGDNAYDPCQNSWLEKGSLGTQDRQKYELWNITPKEKSF